MYLVLDNNISVERWALQPQVTEKGHQFLVQFSLLWMMVLNFLCKLCCWWDIVFLVSCQHLTNLPMFFTVFMFLITVLTCLSLSYSYLVCLLLLFLQLLVFHLYCHPSPNITLHSIATLAKTILSKDLYYERVGRSTFLVQCSPSVLSS